MTDTKALNGLTPSRKRGGAVNSNATNEYPIASGFSTNIFSGDIVCNAAGNVVVLSVSTQKAIGVFQGCKYTANGEIKYSNYWPSGTSSDDAVAFVVDDPQATFIVQADASVTAGDIMSKNFSCTLGAGSTVTGRSGFGIEAASRTDTTGGILRPIAVFNEPGNDISVDTERAFPKVEVRIVRHVDAYISADSSAN
tara:strand:+ start:338 stop:925 length:588 start_codon:yes stop_codon:yes gene_type:complete